MSQKQLTTRRVMPTLRLLIPLTALCVSSPALAQSGAGADPPPPAGEAAQSAGEYVHPEHGSMSNVAAKLSNPTSTIWALTTAWGLPTFYDGDVNEGNPEVGVSAVFQPVMPIPLYGEGDELWKLITRPIVPILFRQPLPTGLDEFDYPAAIGDIQLPLLLAPPTHSFDPPGGKWILAGGPVFEFPSATDNDLSANQWSMGIATALGYANKKITALIFPNYFWHVASQGQGDTPNTSKLTMLYQFTYRLGNGYEILSAPTITYNHKASSGNKWNVPVGLMFGRTLPIFGHPVKIVAGVEYSVVSQDDFGKRAQVRLDITPVIPSFIQKPLFGK